MTVVSKDLPADRAMTKLRDRRISQRTVEGLSVEEKDAVFWDCDLPGFGLGVYPNGRKIYVVQTRGHGNGPPSRAMHSPPNGRAV